MRKSKAPVIIIVIIAVVLNIVVAAVGFSAIITINDKMSDDYVSRDADEDETDDNAADDEEDEEAYEEEEAAAEDETAAEDEDETADDEEPAEASAIGTVTPDSYYWLSADKNLQDILLDDSINAYLGNLYASYEGEMGMPMEPLRDKDLNGDGIADTVTRKFRTSSNGDVFYYEFTFSDGTGFHTEETLVSPTNEADVIQYKDIDGDNICEILYTHLVDGTGGVVATRSRYYHWTGEEWYMEYLHDTYEGEQIGALVGFDDSGEGFVRDVELTDDGLAYLMDFGGKTNEVIETDLYGVLIAYDTKHKGWYEVGSGEDYVQKYWIE